MYTTARADASASTPTTRDADADAARAGERAREGGDVRLNRRARVDRGRVDGATRDATARSDGR